MNNLDIIFFGTPKFSTGSLQALLDHPQVNIKAVVTGLDKKVGRGQKIKETEVASFANAHGIHVIKTDNINRDHQLLEELGEVQLYIVVAFSQFLSQKVLDTPTLGCFNLHTSLLPKYRGAAPIQYAILNGDKETGVCIQRMVSKMDAGDVVVQKNVSISDDDTSMSLFEKLEKECTPTMTTFIDQVLNESLEFTKQDPALVSYAPTIKKTDGMLSFKGEKSQDLINKARAYTPWPGTYTFINDMRIKVLEIEEEKQDIEPGFINTDLNTLLIGTETSAVRLKVVQLEGKKPIKDFEFINGQKRKFDHFTLTKANL